MLDSSMMSIQSATHIVNQSFVEDFRQELKEIKEKLLKITDKEIDNLSYETTKLKQEIQDQKRQIELLKEVTNSPQQLKRGNLTPISRTLLNMRVNTAHHSPLRLARSILQKNSSDQSSRHVTQKHQLESNAQLKTDTPFHCSQEENGKRIQHRSSEGHPVEHRSSCHRVVILGDGQGRGLRDVLQDLLGPEYAVVSYLKPAAALSNILQGHKTKISNMTKNDYVIVLGGCSDKDPYDINIHLHH